MARGFALAAALSTALVVASGQTALTPASVPTLRTSAPLPISLCSVQPPYGQWGPLTQFIAGLDSNAYSLSMSAEQQAGWRSFSRIAGADWGNLQRRYLDRIGAWRDPALGKGHTEVALYPFSGPDSANMFAFFPDAREYVMVGLEPVGCIPAGVQDYTASYFAELRRSLEPVVAMGFFRTNDMEREFSQGTVNGVLPLLLFLMTREGYSVVAVTPITINAAGMAIPSANQPKGETGGVAIQFTDPRHGLRTLRYFSLNLLDSRIKHKPGTLKYFESIPAANTLVKSASYLMHKEYFSFIRDLILDKSHVIVEDDSGIPLHFFKPSTWDVRLYGSYAEPIALFKNWHQEDLKMAFSAGVNVQPLDFGIGYRSRSQSNLLVAFHR